MAFRDSQSRSGHDLVLELHSDISHVGRAVEYVLARCAHFAGDARRLGFNFRVGLTEALTNAMMYGNGADPEKRVCVEVRFEGDWITARVTDQGTGFDPTGVPDPTVDPYRLRPNGRGLFLMRQLLDEVRYNKQGNSVTLVLCCKDGMDRLGGGAPA
jgi:serine/threonine-protein kinase RsbW